MQEQCSGGRGEASSYVDRAAAFWIARGETKKKRIISAHGSSLTQRNEGGGDRLTAEEEADPLVKVWSSLRFAAGAHREATSVVVHEGVWKRVRMNVKRWVRKHGVVAYGAAVIALTANGMLEGDISKCMAGDVWDREHQKFWDEAVRMGHVGGLSDIGEVLRPGFSPWEGGSLPELRRALEHPRGALQHRPFIRKEVKDGLLGVGSRQWHLTLWSRCKTGDQWRKDSMLLHRGFHWEGPGQCHWDCGQCLRNPATGKMRHLLHIGGKQSHSLYKKHRLPQQLLSSVSEAVRPSDGVGDLDSLLGYDEEHWMLDLFCGTESWKVESARRGWGYIGVDWCGRSYLRREGGRMVGRFVMSLMGVTLAAVLHMVYVSTGLDPRLCVLVWYSPPCEYYSRLSLANKRYRDWKDPSYPPLPGHPTEVDDMIKGLVQDESA